MGGYDGRFILSDSEIYDPLTNSFIIISPMNIPRTYHTSTLLNDGRVLITGGFGKQSEKLKSAEIFHPETNTFELIGNLIIACGGANQFGQIRSCEVNSDGGFRLLNGQL